MSWPWQCMPVILAFRRLRQENLEFEASWLLAILCLKQINKQTNKNLFLSLMSLVRAMHGCCHFLYIQTGEFRGRRGSCLLMSLLGGKLSFSETPTMRLLLH
jgi:hypothetical protein